MKENTYFWRDMPTFTSLIQAHFHMTYSRTSLLCPYKTIIPEGNKKSVFTPCTMPSGTEMFSFRDGLPDIATHKAAVFHLVLWQMWILPKSLTQQYFLFLPPAANLSLTLSSLSPQISFNNPAFQALFTFLPLLLNINYFFSSGISLQFSRLNIILL